jgi:hypothetical protein
VCRLARQFEVGVHLSSPSKILGGCIEDDACEAGVKKPMAQFLFHENILGDPFAYEY